MVDLILIGVEGRALGRVDVALSSRGAAELFVAAVHPTAIDALGPVEHLAKLLARVFVAAVRLGGLTLLEHLVARARHALVRVLVVNCRDAHLVAELRIDDVRGPVDFKRLVLSDAAAEARLRLGQPAPAAELGTDQDLRRRERGALVSALVTGTLEAVPLDSL